MARKLYETLRRRSARRNHIYFLLIKKADELGRKRVVAAACDPDLWGRDPGCGSLGNDVDDAKPLLLRGMLRISVQNRNGAFFFFFFFLTVLVQTSLQLFGVLGRLRERSFENGRQVATELITFTLASSCPVGKKWGRFGACL